jgi:hypothetical protein
VRWALVVAMMAAGCSSGETTALVTVEPASVQPQSLRVSMWGDGPIRSPADLSLSAHPLPGSLLIRHLDAHTPDFRVLVEGLDGAGNVNSQAAAHLLLTEGQETRATLQLVDGLLADSDGDGVPDLVDDCPNVPDSDQRCAAPHSDGAIDLARGDLSQVPGQDLSGSANDLAHPMDLANADLTPSAACPSFAFFCDDFEEGYFDLTKWQMKYDSAGGSTLEVDNLQPFKGTQSVYVQATGGLVWQAHTFTPITSGMLAVRGYFYSDPALAPSIYFFYLHRAGTAPVDADWVVGYDNISSSGQWTIYNKNSGSGYSLSASAAAGTWHCVELDLAINGDGSNTASFFVDGTAATPVTTATSAGSTTFSEFDVGVSYIAGSSANKFHIDDVALATQHIGCE